MPVYGIVLIIVAALAALDLYQVKRERDYEPPSVQSSEDPVAYDYGAGKKPVDDSPGVGLTPPTLGKIPKEANQ